MGGNDRVRRRIGRLRVKPRLMVILAGVILALSGALAASAWAPLPVKDDPLVRMPGTQPGQVSLESPNRCMNCHAGYNESVEPGFNWAGSMMAQSARDFLYFSCLAVAAQDAIWAVGNPNGADICLRCHFPKGWLEGRSDPTNASAMTGADWDGVQCDFCHRMYDPFFEDTYAGTREGNDWAGYWDEAGVLSAPGASETRDEDAAIAPSISLFNGGSFFVNNQPFSASYGEATSGQYFVSPNSDKRASFADADARHQMLYSRFHKSMYMCATCHDVSNPILANLGQDGSSPLTTETQAAYSYFHVERTFSEFMLSDYGQQGGADGIGPFAPGVYETSNPGNAIAMCQDCHMRDVGGVGADKAGAIDRPAGSTEHPQSGQPLHDLTGGNVWVSTVLASAVPGSPNYDPVNDDLLNQGPVVLTIDLTEGQGIDPVALLAGADRARQQLELAAAIQNVEYSSVSGELSFRVQNQTGHKLISGFPEGRRMFINIKAYVGGSLVYEVNPYDDTVGTLKGLPHSASSPPLGPDEVYVDELVYEMHPSSTLTGETETFHFALADGRYKDNRIPPKGFDIAVASDRLAVPVWHGVEDPNYYTAAEYAGGYDDVSMTIATGADTVEISLYYQTTSREYIEFLRDEIKGTGNLTLSSPTPSGEANAYIVQSDPFFSQLKAWGDTIWQLWTHNMNVDGAAPYLMAAAEVGAAPPALPPTPTLLSAEGGQKLVTLTWSDEQSADPAVIGYNVYYDQAGKSQFVADAGLATTYTDADLTDGQEYCYMVTSYTATAESTYSNILCATPLPPGQTITAGVDSLETGRYETTGKGKDKVTVFVATTTFARGDGVVIRAHVVDSGTGLPLADATVEISIAGPETVTLTTGPSNAAGVAEATWQTDAPNRKGEGGTAPGSYTATTSNVTANGYQWDGVATATGFIVE